jgi:hypothetical protein
MRFEGARTMRLKPWLTPLNMLYTRAPAQLCCSVLRCMTNPATLRPLLLECPDQGAREAVQGLLQNAILKVLFLNPSPHSRGAHESSVGAT